MDWKYWAWPDLQVAPVCGHPADARRFGWAPETTTRVHAELAAGSLDLHYKALRRIEEGPGEEAALVATLPEKKDPPTLEAAPEAADGGDEGASVSATAAVPADGGEPEAVAEQSDEEEKRKSMQAPDMLAKYNVSGWYELWEARKAAEAAEKTRKSSAAPSTPAPEAQAPPPVAPHVKPQAVVSPPPRAEEGAAAPEASP
eukprot:7681895-Alexandrium_andersonii.AAC.1